MGKVLASEVLRNLIADKMTLFPTIGREHLDQCPECTNTIDDTVSAVIEFIKDELGIDLFKLRI